jgi:Tol biopolymer transport system component
LVDTLQGDTGWDVWLYTVDDGSLAPFLEGEHNEGTAVFSPDGRWVVYASDESGRSEIYVRAFPGPGGKWQVSAAGGNLPTWNPDGGELFYVGLDEALMAVPVETDGGFSPAAE